MFACLKKVNRRFSNNLEAWAVTIQHVYPKEMTRVNSFILVSRIYLDGIAAKFDLNPTTLLVLVGLANHFNPDKNIVFPSQEYLSRNLNISERSVIRAIKYLLDKKLIIKARKGLNNIYCFTTVFFDSVKMSVIKCQNVIHEDAKMSVKHDKSKLKNNIVNFQKNENTGVNYLNTEETKKMLAESRDIKRGSPLDYTYEEALKFLDSLIPELQNSFFARELRKKWELSPQHP